jgi:hypothetical protein
MFVILFDVNKLYIFGFAILMFVSGNSVLPLFSNISHFQQRLILVKGGSTT